jgi:DNA-binding MarR family transcriptional regulator
MSTEAEPGAAELSGLILQVADRLRAGFNAAAADLDLPPAQALVLSRLSAPVPMRALAEWLSCEPSNVTGIVDGLECRGLVTRRPAPSDRRVKHVVLTEEGERRRAELRSRSHSRTEALFTTLSTDRTHLHALLTRLLAAPPDPR